MLSVSIILYYECVSRIKIKNKVRMGLKMLIYLITKYEIIINYERFKPKTLCTFQ